MTQMNLSMKQKRNTGYKEQSGGYCGSGWWERVGFGVWD